MAGAAGWPVTGNMHALRGAAQGLEMPGEQGGLGFPLPSLHLPGRSRLMRKHLRKIAGRGEEGHCAERTDQEDKTPLTLDNNQERTTMFQRTFEMGKENGSGTRTLDRPAGDQYVVGVRIQVSC